MTYWPRKCATWCAPRNESFHQVWSWYDYPFRCLVSVIGADTLSDLVTLTFDFLTLVSGHTWRSRDQRLHQIWRCYGYTFWSYEFPTSPIGYHWQCACSHCACAVSRDLCVGGKFFPHIWNPWPRFAYTLCNFYGATIKTNEVIRQNNVWPCAKDHTALSACAKSCHHWTLP